jgi:signal transduction histidine kinase
VSHNPVRNDEGRIIGVVVFAQDITERKLLEQEKDQFAKELGEKNIELERFTYTVSHDLKSPLVTIKTFLGYLPQDMTASDKQRVEKDLLFMNGAADKMGLLLQELLEMSRIGRIINPPVKINSAELIKEAVGIVAGSIADRGVKIEVSGESVTLYGDRSRLLEIWQNLLENAVKFMGDRPSPQINIGIEHHGSEIVFFVRDNGIGIEPQYQSKIFNLFEKINVKTEGTGMGLAITKRIVELYQGRIWVESKGLGQGTSFFFTLPGALVDKDKGGSA